ncbi:MAG: hypothetical protein ACLUVC_12365 [Longibaculum sp.]
MKRIQINHIVVNEDILKEIKRYMVAPWQRYLLLLTGIIAFVASVMNFMNKQYPLGIILVVLGVVCFFEIYWLNNKKYKDILKTMQKETEKSENIYTLIFGSDALTIRNCDMATDNKMTYERMKRIVETPSTYTVFGKKNQFAVIRKDALKMKPVELFDFIKTKETKIKKFPNA